jgi:FixJ family two-component response regulator
VSTPRPTVYVVDDDLSFRKAVSRLLQAAGYEVLGYSSAESFLADIPRTREDTCVLCDVRMSGHSGMDVQRALIEQGSPLTIIFMTGFADRHTEEQALAGGAIDFLPKPFGKDRLLGAVSRALSVSRDSPLNDSRRQLLRSPARNLPRNPPRPTM